MALIAVNDGPTEQLPDDSQVATSTEDYNSIDESTDTYSITVEYPTTGVGAQAVEEYVKNRVAEFKNQAPETTEGEFFRQHKLQIEIKRHSLSGTISYVANGYVYKGGANGMAFVETFVFDESGQELTLAEVVPEENRSALVSAVREELRAVNNLAEDEELPFEFSFETIEHFYLTDNQIVTAFSEYEVAPGAAGIVRVELPADPHTAVDPQVATTTDASNDDSSLAQACGAVGGKWLEQYGECEGVQEGWCDEQGGEFKVCASRCRNNPEMTGCTTECVRVCQFE